MSHPRRCPRSREVVQQSGLTLDNLTEPGWQEWVGGRLSGKDKSSWLALLKTRAGEGPNAGHSCFSLNLLVFNLAQVSDTGFDELFRFGILLAIAGPPFVQVVGASFSVGAGDGCVSNDSRTRSRNLLRPGRAVIYCR